MAFAADSNGGSSPAGLRALVTGAGSGIGRATAEALVAAGARVAGLDRDGFELDGVLALRADVADGAAVAVAVRRAGEELGGLDAVVNAAGIGAVGDVAANDDEEWHRLYDVNVLGIVRVCRAALPLLRASERGAIVNVASIAATAGLPQRVCYTATKGAVLSMSRAMAADLVADRIRVNCVSPGTVDTPWVGRLLAAADDPAAARAALEARQPMGRLAAAEEVAAAILYLATPASGFTTGSIVEIDGGMAGLRMPR
jgi:NAD(P)-dependent dehydrogenase (short-subunit alcohol dehydrogenase family)